MHNSVETEVIDLELEIEQTEVTGDALVPPCLLIRGTKTPEEWNFLRNRSCREEYSIPMYIEFESVRKLAGKAELTLSYLLMLRHLNTNYELMLHKPDGSSTTLDLNDAKMLEKFICL